jgi:hypothetical protein
MVETSDGHFSSASDSGETRREVPVCAVVGRAWVPPPTAVASAPLQLERPLMEQLQVGLGIRFSIWFLGF